MEIFMLKNLFFIIALLSIIIVSVGFAQEDKPILTNMLEDAVAKSVKSMSAINPKIKTVSIWSLEAAAGSPIDVALVEKKLSLGLVRAGDFKRFMVIDTPALQMRAAEKGLELSKVIDRKKMVEVGVALGIDAFLYGSVALEGEEFILTLNLIDTKMGNLAWFDEIKGHDQVLIAKREQEAERARSDLERQQAGKKTKSEPDAVLRSILLPGLGQFYTGSNSRGITYLFIEVIGWAIYIQDVVADSSTSNKESDNAQKTIGLALIGANHIVSAVDAGLSAYRYNSALRSKYNLSLNVEPKSKRFLLSYSYQF